jgi:hypothetical protein
MCLMRIATHYVSSLILGQNIKKFEIKLDSRELKISQQDAMKSIKG